MLPNKATFLEVVAAIQQERRFQDSKHGSIEQEPHTPAGWMFIARKELEEAENSLLKGGMNRDSWRHELIQTAAVCIAALEQHGLYSPDPFRREI